MCQVLSDMEGPGRILGNMNNNEGYKIEYDRLIWNNMDKYGYIMTMNDIYIYMDIYGLCFLLLNHGQSFGVFGATFCEEVFRHLAGGLAQI